MCCCLFSGVGMVAISCRDVASESFIARGDSEICISHPFPCEYTYVLRTGKRSLNISFGVRANRAIMVLLVLILEHVLILVMVSTRGFRFCID